MNTTEATAILERYRKGESKPGEMELIDEWYKQLVETGDWQWEEGEKEKMQKLLEDSLLTKIHTKKPVGVVRKINIWKRTLPTGRQVAVAASLVMVFTTGYWLIKDKGQKSETVAIQLAKDVAPPNGNKAVITLANGQTVALDSVTSGTLATQGDVTVIKNADGEIVYSGNGTEIAYNTLYNPRGSKVVNLTLQDGSKVWLNAESSLKFPVAFVGNERKVEITGEAYFEVAKDAAKKFLVNANGVTTEVLGTHFNVNAYNDEEAVKVTLLEGSVKVSQNLNSKIIKPGQQARFGSNEIKIENANVDEVMAWKNGLFSFNKANIQTVMRQLARWYDVDVGFEGKAPVQLFGGEIQRNIPLSKVLENLEKNGVHFRIEDKKIVVL